jgi:amino acid transporter
VAKIVLGSAGAIVVTLAALVSTYGAISANTVSVPRITFAFAESGDLPSIFSAVHPTFRTPYVSILVFGVLTWLLALLGNFSWNVTLSALARLFYYGLVCAALLVLRRKQAGAASLQLPAGSLFAVLGIITCLLLVTRVDLSGSLILLGIVAIALLNWAIVRTRQPLEKSAI